MDIFSCPRIELSSGHCRSSIGSSTQASLSEDCTPSVLDSATSDDIHDSPVASSIDLDEAEDVPLKRSPSPLTFTAKSPDESKPTKRPRGRPRKHPPGPRRVDSKNAFKARSKTGCITCRRRKKKCDETKPSCLNCRKTNAICEGYRLPEHWQGGRNKTVDKSKRLKELPVLIKGVENDIDRVLLDHFNYNLSQTLCLCHGPRSPFNELIVPMALEDSGLMHSLLCLSGFHFVASQTIPDYVGPEVVERRDFHFDKAVTLLRSKDMDQKHTCDQSNIIDDPTVAQTIMLCLKTVMAGEHQGEYRMHLDAARHLITCQQSPNEPLQNFLMEFFVYHDVSNAVTSLNRKPPLYADDFHLPSFVQSEAGSYLGVLDYLFISISKVTVLRDKIRSRREAGLTPPVDYQALSEAQTIDSELRSWICPQEEGTPRYIASLLYRQCVWIYLHRTILPSAPDPNLCEAVDEGLEYLKQLDTSDGAPAILLMPVFLLGCAAFELYQRESVSEALDRLLEFRHAGNIAHARTVVENIWKMMDNEDDGSWDWEGLMDRLGLDFMVS